MSQSIDAAYIEAVFHRLRRHYAEHARLPLAAGAEHRLGCNGDVCHCSSDEVIRLGQLQKLYRYVISEGYGE